MSLLALLALLWIWFTGALAAALCLGAAPSARGRGLLVGGAGFLLGCLIAGNLLWLQGQAPLDEALPAAGGWLGLLTVLLGLLAWRRSRVTLDASRSMRPTRHVQQPASEALPAWVAGLSLFLITLAFLALLIQAWSLPVLTWDAWNAWLAKSKAWYYAGHFLPALGIEAWLASAAPEAAIANVAPGYPEAVPRLLTALAVLNGAWRDGQLALLWPLLWLSGAAMFGGALRQRGAGFSLAAVGTAALFCLPLIASHAALAGYMDLWLGLLVLLAVVLADIWRRRGERAALAGFLVCVALLPTVKLEGSVYSLLLLLAWLFWAAPVWLRWTLGAASVLVLLPLWWSVGISLPLPGLGWARFSPGEISLPLLGTLALAWRPVSPVVLQSVFMLPNWSLLWFLVPVILLARRRRLGEQGLTAGFLLAAAGFQFCLFFFTDASAWAENLTSLNRLLMHVAPAWVWLLSVLLIYRPGIRGRYR